MEKEKLRKKRETKGLSQCEIADKMCMDVSNYCRREKGLKKIAIYEWEKLAGILEVPLEEIYEPDDKQVFICNDNATVHYQGTNVIYSIPEHLLETQRKYIEKLENENLELKQRIHYITTHKTI